MSFKKLALKIKERFVVENVKRAKIPEFKSSHVVRKHINFVGNVQNVGFRFETYQLATRLGLTGWVKNLQDFSVEAEVQGEADKVNYLVSYMSSLKRAYVSNAEIVEIPVLETDTEFKMEY